MLTQSREVSGGGDSRFTHQHAWVLDEVGHPKRMVDVCLHRAKVAIVDAKQRISRMGKPNMVDDAVEIVGIVNFEQSRHAQLDAENLKVDNLTLAQTLGDEQERIGASGSSLPDLIGVDNEILAKHRQGDRISNRVNELKFAAEIFVIGEARNR